MDQNNSPEQNRFLLSIKLILKDYRLYLLLMPILIWYGLWYYQPLAGLLIAFKTSSRIGGLG